MKTSRLLSSRAFTLLEVLIALTICGFVMDGLMKLYIYVLSNNYIAEQRLGANDDVRYFTQQMIMDARASNIVQLYPCFYGYTTANNAYPFTGAGADSTAVTPSTATVPLGQTGDYVVFLSYSDPYMGPPVYNGIGNVPAMYVNRIILYWIAANRPPFDGSSPGIPAETAMYRFDSNNTGGVLPWSGVALGPTTSVLTTTVTVPSLLPAGTLTNAQANWAQVVLNDVRGLATDSIAGDIGYNFINWQNTNKTNASILMHSLILHGNASKRLTDTYNFTITPGG
jgi:prepilin-type N-terminal cleavage/methylation domain-containing protein